MTFATTFKEPGDLRHRILIAAMATAATAVAIALLWGGLEYYRLPLGERPFHAQHRTLRPAGQLGVRLGLVCLVMFLGIYLYPLRKRIKFLQRIGKTRRWLDFHVLVGILVPIYVTLHASFKLQGLVGIAYWIMMAIVASGFVGRYLYAHIHRSAHEASISITELEQEIGQLATELHDQELVPRGDMERVLALPSRNEVAAMKLHQALLTMLVLDFRRPFQVATLRRRFLGAGERLITAGGLLHSGHRDLERVIDAVREQSWLMAKALFLSRAGEIFHLWHVVHRPFSYSFVVIVLIHVTLVLLMGYL
ncbi:MAG: hypothetical protein HZB13_20890 [Acidobacteria bacterium]|nr:hypothetical protein [Acidobacteriota bacterium]